MRAVALLPSMTMLMVSGVLQEMRQQCSSPKPKNMITRLLFILTQCTRLLLTGLSAILVFEFHDALALLARAGQPMGWNMYLCHCVLVKRLSESTNQHNWQPIAQQDRAAGLAISLYA